jgi:hypothetical protein
MPLSKRWVVKDVVGLRLLDAQGNVVRASIVARVWWMGDNSLKWVTIHFITDLPTKNTGFLAKNGGRF